MSFKSLLAAASSATALGAALTVFCGLLIWGTSLGDVWEDASYDSLFRFGAREVTNQVVLIQMDDAAYACFQQKRGERWDRSLHANLLNRLAADACPLVVLDIHFGETVPATDAERTKDKKLAEALGGLRHAVLMAEVTEPVHPQTEMAEVELPVPLFLNAATNWGVGKLNPAADGIVRRHWPFPAPLSGFPSLPWAAAQLVHPAAAKFPKEQPPQEQWLRYYGPHGAWERLSYQFASNQPPDFFRDKIVFLGNAPPPDEASTNQDAFRTPYGNTVGGMEILATEFLNLMNGDWLRRPPAWVEFLILVAAGMLLGWGFAFVAEKIVAVAAGRLPPRATLVVALAGTTGLALATALGLMLAFAAWSYFTNYWFPWLVIAGAQVICALVVALGAVAAALALRRRGTEWPPPDFDLIKSIGTGGFGEVWLARDAGGNFVAVKKVERQKSGDPCKIEFKGIARYIPVCTQHPGLLQIGFLSRIKWGEYFYYTMVLADARQQQWKNAPATYKPRVLTSERAESETGRLPPEKCVDLGVDIAEALAFLHQKKLVHRDVKPSNIVFIEGRPKLADMGLVSDIRLPKDMTNAGGTFDYLPTTPNEPLGTPATDVYALGKVLYEVSTGLHPREAFPVLPPAVVENAGVWKKFKPLNDLILKACEADWSRRLTAAELHRALLELQKHPDGCAAGDAPAEWNFPAGAETPPQEGGAKERQN